MCPFRSARPSMNTTSGPRSNRKNPRKNKASAIPTTANTRRLSPARLRAGRACLTRSVRRACVTSAFHERYRLCQMRTSAFLLMLGACASQAHGQSAAAPSPGDAYVAMLSTYAARPAQAVRALSQWRTRDVERVLAQIPRTAAGSIVLAGELAPNACSSAWHLHAETALAHYERDDIAAMGAHLAWSQRIVHRDFPWPTSKDAPVVVVNPEFTSDWALTIVGSSRPSSSSPKRDISWTTN